MWEYVELRNTYNKNIIEEYIGLRNVYNRNIGIMEYIYQKYRKNIKD